jgi:hypothetical protein
MYIPNEWRLNYLKSILNVWRLTYKEALCVELCKEWLGHLIYVYILNSAQNEWRLNHLVL